MDEREELIARADKYLNTGSGEFASEIMRDMADYIRRSIPAQGTPKREWDEGEHEGCGIDSQRALEHFNAQRLTPEQMGRAYYLARYEKDGAKWEANDHKMLWVRMAQRYHEILASSDTSTPGQAAEKTEGGAS